MKEICQLVFARSGSVSGLVHSGLIHFLSSPPDSVDSASYNFYRRLLTDYCPFAWFSFILFYPTFRARLTFSSTLLISFLSPLVYHPQHIAHYMLPSPKLHSFGTLHILHRRISSNPTIRAPYPFFPVPQCPSRQHDQPAGQSSRLGRPSSLASPPSPNAKPALPVPRHPLSTLDHPAHAHPTPT